MIKSLRWRLQIWYTGLLLAVVGGFGSILFYQVRASKLQEIDGQLEAAALYLDATLRGFPQFALEGRDLPPPPPREKKGPQGLGRQGSAVGQRQKARDRRRETESNCSRTSPCRELDGPADLPDAERPYFCVWRGDGGVLKTTPLPDGLTPHADEDAVPARPQAENRGPFREVWMRGPRETRLVVGRSVARERAALNAFGWQLVGIGARRPRRRHGGRLLAGVAHRPPHRRHVRRRRGHLRDQPLHAHRNG